MIFLKRFFPIELRKAKTLEFMNLRKGDMTIQEYGIKFNKLSMYASKIVAESRGKTNKFLYKVSYLVKNRVQKCNVTGRHEHL